MGDERNEITSRASESSGAPAAVAARGRPMSAEQLVRSLAAITASFYVLGFLTTIAYLYKLGTNSAFRIFRC